MFNRDIQTTTIIEDPIEIGSLETGFFEKRIECESWYSPWTIVSVFDGNIKCILSYQDNIYETDITQGVSKIDYEFKGEYIDIKFYSFEKAMMRYCYMDFMNMEALDLDHEDMRIVDHPVHEASIGVDLEKAFSLAKGWEDVNDRNAQIKMSDNSIYNISKSTVNFRWYNDLLSMNLPIGQSYYFRAKYKGSRRGWTKWSKWLKFKPKRKMPL